MQVVSLSDTSFPELQHWSHVAVYEDIGDVSQSFEKIAVLDVTTAPTKKKMIRDCQRRAAEMGANGIILDKVGEHTNLNLIFTGTVYIPVADHRWGGRILAIRRI